MTVFVVLTPPSNPSLSLVASALTRVFGADRFRLIAPGQFLATRSGVTSHQIADLLGNQGEIGQFVVFATSGHHGWHQKDIWEWIAAQEAMA